MDDVDLYGDLDNEASVGGDDNGNSGSADGDHHLNDYAIIQEYEDKLTKENQRVVHELNQVKEQLNKMVRANKILKANISSLFKTARAELERKNERIGELTRQLDDMIFRRNTVRRENQRPILKPNHEENVEVTEDSGKNCDQQEIIKEERKVAGKVMRDDPKQGQANLQNVFKPTDVPRSHERQKDYHRESGLKKFKDDERHHSSSKNERKDRDSHHYMKDVNRRRHERIATKPYSR